jgi:hypothetical protein
MAIDIELLNKINNILYVGKSLKVYQALKMILVILQIFSS